MCIYKMGAIACGEAKKTPDIWSFTGLNFEGKFSLTCQKWWSIFVHFVF